MKKNFYFMFRFVFCSFLFFAFFGSVFAQTLLPESKVMIKLEPDEPNPFSFAKKAPAAKTAQPTEDAEGEAGAIQGVLQKMAVSGYTESGVGRSVLLDRMRVQAGDYLPPVIPKQTESVRVEAIYPDRVEFAFEEKVDKKGKKMDRTFMVRYSLKPEVRYMLGAQDPPRRAQPIELQGVFPPLKKSPQDEESSP